MSSTVRWRRFLIGTLALGAVFLATAVTSTEAMAEGRVALVIGNAAYENAPRLANPRNDAEAVAAALARLGFEVVRGFDLKIANFRDLMSTFGRTVEGADVALVYYAGHAVQVGGRNYVLPVDSKLEREQDLHWQTIPLDVMIDELSGAGKLKLVMLDACRDNPLAQRMARGMGTRSVSVGRGLAPVQRKASDTLIAYATGADDVAEDGRGRHSPFTEAVLQHIEEPGLEIRLFFGKVASTVRAKTGNRQEPYVYTSLGAETFYWKPGSAAAASAGLPPPAGATADVVFWQSIQASTNPADFQAYLAQFPSGTFAALARNRLAALSSGTGRVAAPSAGQVREAQSLLRQLGYNPGPADGVMGAGTRAAVESFQREHGLAVTGEATDTLLAALTGALAAAPVGAPPAVQPGARSDLPRVIDRRLRVGDTVIQHRYFDYDKRMFVVGQQEAFRNRIWRVVAITEEQIIVELLSGGQGDLQPGARINLFSSQMYASLFPQAERHHQIYQEFRPVAGYPPETVGQAVPPQPAPPPEVPPGTTFIEFGQTYRDCAECPEMVLLPPGIFDMGDASGDEDEKPVHRVTIPRPVAVGKFEVTQAEWRALMGNNPSQNPGDRNPVENVTWNDAREYARRLSAKTGWPYRLLSEAEWEYAARAGSRTRFPWGDQATHDYANYGRDDVGGPAAVGRDRWQFNAPVGSFPANGFGLFDMTGNVWEWVEDCHNTSYIGAPTNGSAWLIGNCSGRILRGGSSVSPARELRSSFRNFFASGSRFDGVGFRVARQF